MIAESMFLFLLIGSGTSYEEQYIGKISDCLHAQSIVKKVKQKTNKNISGYICINSESFTARKKFMKQPTPAEKKVIEDIRELIPEPKPKPLIPLKRKE